MRSVLFFPAMVASGVLWAQAYVPFPDSNVVWTVSYNSSDCKLWGPPEQVYEYHYEGDTSIAGNAFHRVVRSNSCWSCCGGNMDGYFGALRNDTSERQIIFVPAGNDEPTVLFDFSLGIGDHPSYCGSAVVSDIDTVLTPAGPRRRFLVDGPCWSNEFIEGVGSVNGFTGFYIDSGEYLACQRINEQVAYENDFQGCLVSPMWTASPLGPPALPKLVVVALYGSTSISRSDRLQLYGQMEVVNACGDRVSLVRLNGTSTVTLDVPVAEGIYVVRWMGLRGTEALGAKFVVRP